MFPGMGDFLFFLQEFVQKHMETEGK